MALPLRVLLIEDNVDDALLLVEELRRGGYDVTFERIETADEMRAVLIRQPWDVILVDFSLPHFSGPLSLQVLRESGQDIPVIIVSGTVTEQQAIDMMHSGAADFILKSNLARLTPIVQRELREAEARRERRQAREALRANELKYRMLFAVEPDALLLIDTTTCAIVEANEAAQGLFGYTQEEFLHLTILELSADPEKTSASIAGTREGDTTVVHESYYRNKARRVFPVELSARRFTLDGRSLIFASIRDISARKEVEKALDRERAFLSSAIELLPFPIVFNSPDGRVIRANRASYQFFGGTDPDHWWEYTLLTADTHIAIPPENWPMMRSTHGQVVPAVEAIMVCPNGTEIPILAHSAPIYINGQLVATVVAFQDITALKEADRAKNQFLAVLSHELKTPLTSIIGWAQRAIDAPELMPEALRIIERNAQRQRSILNNLLDVSKIIAGTFVIKRVPAELWQIAEAATAEMAPLAEARQMHLVSTPPGEPLPVLADVVRLREVLVNLISNAIKFTDPGGTITLTAVRDGRWAVLSVQDTGRGIPPEELSHLFRPFQQVERSEITGGLGLGLALVKGIVELHDGQIIATSAGGGQGSTFTIRIPLREEE
ncbi:MAG: sensor histidine kinase [Armatimonadota bacterium]